MGRNTGQPSLVPFVVETPSVVRAAFNVLRVLVVHPEPQPTGDGEVDHSGLLPVLEALSDGGLEAARELAGALEDYLSLLAAVDPDSLSPFEALAYWVNLYNAGAIGLAVEAHTRRAGSVLRVPGAFSRPMVEIAGEALSLDAIEHAKVRRLGDPRIHAALVCGSLSCPTLRPEPFTGEKVDAQLDDQLRAFLARGGAVGLNGTVHLSRVFLWYGADFVRPHRMPTLLPARRSRVLNAIRPWLPPDASEAGRVEFQDYDWGLGCEVG